MAALLFLTNSVAAFYSSGKTTTPASLALPTRWLKEDDLVCIGFTGYIPALGDKKILISRFGLVRVYARTRPKHLDARLFQA